jgi:hypothetical protein
MAPHKVRVAAAVNNTTRFAVAFACTVVGAACGDGSPVADIPVRVQVLPTRDTVIVGTVSLRLSARVFNAQNREIPGAVVTWRSDQPFIATVDSLTGAVTGVSNGLAAITARAGFVSDTAEVVVLAALQLSLPLDTILLTPGDTFTIPVDVLVANGGPTPAITFGGGGGGIASVDPATGVVTALNPGTIGFVAHADTVSAAGGIEVRIVPDTINGFAYVGLAGAVTRRGRLSSRAFNHPTDDGRTLFQIAARGAAGIDEYDTFLIDSLVAPETRAVETQPPSAIAPGTDPVCRPTASFAFYRNLATGIVGLSLAGGTVTVTSDAPTAGGRAISGRFSVTLQRTDVTGPEGAITALGTFVVPLVSLATCPK